MTNLLSVDNIGNLYEDQARQNRGYKRPKLLGTLMVFLKGVLIKKKSLKNQQNKKVINVQNYTIDKKLISFQILANVLKFANILTRLLTQGLYCVPSNCYCYLFQMELVLILLTNVLRCPGLSFCRNHLVHLKFVSL